MGGWLRNFTYKASRAISSFMQGRYGTDQLNMVILCAGLIASLLSMILPGAILTLIFWALSWVLMILAIFRTLSRNTYKRFEENRKFRQLLDILKDRDHRYFDCPKCHQRVRVPRGKGKISITCPKCREKFQRKT